MKIGKYAIVSSFALASVTAEAVQRQPHTALKQFAGFTEDELRDMEQGKVVSKVLETNNKTEVAVIAVVWIDALVEELIEKQKDIENFEHGDAVLAIQKINKPPKPANFAKLTLPEEDIRDLAKCKVGDCPVKVDDVGLEALQRRVDWKAANVDDQVNAVARDLMLDAVEAYSAGGDKALGAYRDKKRPLYIAKEFEGLLENSPYVLYYDPKLHDYLLNVPNDRPEGVDEYLYWSKVKFGLKPVVRLSHVVIYPIEGARAAEYVIASKMLHASHYFHTGLELKYLVKDSANPDAKGFYFVSVNRSRSDGLTGFFGGIVRSRAQSGARAGLAGAMRNTKQILEAGNRRAAH